MIIKRTIKLDLTIAEKNPLQIGDQIICGKYTATCQKINGDTAIFMLDQYLDKPYKMNLNDCNLGGYPESYLRKELISDFQGDSNFDSIRDILVPDQNGDIVRIPTVREFFSLIDPDYYDTDDAEQWELMKDRKNRIARRESEPYEWGWLQNAVTFSQANFAAVSHSGYVTYGDASHPYLVRPVFSIKCHPLVGGEPKTEDEVPAVTTQQFIQNHYFDSEHDANVALDVMKKVIEDSGVVTVADFKHFGGMEHTEEDHRYGWKNLDDVSVVQIYSQDYGTEYYLNLSEPELLIKNDAVNHPSHYTQGGIECIEAIKASMTTNGFQDYCKGNVLKYIWRWRDKAGVEDLKKASVYLNWIIQSAEEDKNS